MELDFLPCIEIYNSATKQQKQLIYNLGAVDVESVFKYRLLLVFPQVVLIIPRYSVQLVPVNAPG